jgi:NAD-dependent dihydropyrimidine dehydrogenase PreA subunit
MRLDLICHDTSFCVLECKMWAVEVGKEVEGK